MNNVCMIKLKKNNIAVTINDDLSIHVDNQYKDLIKPLINLASQQAEMNYSVADGFYSYFLANKLKDYGFEVLEVSDPQENEATELVVY